MAIGRPILGVVGAVALFSLLALALDSGRPPEQPKWDRDTSTTPALSLVDEFRPARVALVPVASSATETFLATIRVSDDCFTAAEPLSVLLSNRQGQGLLASVEAGLWSEHVPIGQYDIVAALAGDAALAFEASGSLSPESPESLVCFREEATWKLELLDTTTGARMAPSSIRTIPTAIRNATSLFDLLADTEEAPPEESVEVPFDMAGSAAVIPSEGSSVYWAKAAGCDWKAFTRASYQSLVVLPVTSSASLDVEVVYSGGQIPRGLEVIFAPRTLLEERQSVGPDARCRFNRVRSGKSRVVLAAGGNTEHSATLAEAFVDVAVGLENRAVLKLAELSVGGSLDVSVVLPNTVSLKGSALQLLTYVDNRWLCISEKQVDNMEQVVPESVYSHTFMGVEFGEYAVRLSPVGVNRLVTLNEGEPGSLLIDLSDAVEAFVDVQPVSCKGWLNLVWEYDDNEVDGLKMYTPISSTSPTRFVFIAKQLHAQVIGEHGASGALSWNPGAVSRLSAYVDSQYTANLEIVFWTHGSRAYAERDYWSGIKISSVDQQGQFLGYRWGDGSTSLLLGNSKGPDYSSGVACLTQAGKYRIELSPLVDISMDPRVLTLDIPAGHSRVDLVVH